MKTIVVVAFWAIVLSGCKSPATAPNTVGLAEEFQLAYGQTVIIPEARLSLTFQDLGEDSRCPVGAICIWAGNARAIVVVSDFEVSLNTTLEPRQILHRGYSIRLVDVAPYPELGEQHRPENYVITLIAEKE